MKVFLGRNEKYLRYISSTAIFLTVILGFAALFTGNRLLAARRAQNPAVAAVPAQITVTEIPHRGAAPPLQMNDVTVAQGHEHDPITSLVPAQGPQAGLQLLILIDDTDRWSLADQYNELRAFVLQQPSTTAVGVAYMYNGLVQLDQNFTADHNAAAKALHQPLGRQFGGSAYFSLTDMYKQRQWHADPRYPRRAILMFTDGYDAYARPYYTDPYIGESIADMQAAGIQVFSVCTPYAGKNGGFAGGDLLIELSDATGGYPLYTGLLGTPFFKPLLSDFNAMLQHQYLLTFEAHGETRSSLQNIKVTTDVHGVKLAAPDAVFVPGPED